MKKKTNVHWKLNKAMYGLRKAPKKWEETRNAGLKELVVEPQEPGEKQLSLVQCSSAKNIWLIRERQDDGTMKIIGKLLLYVDDAIALSTTRAVERMLTCIKDHWSLSIKGILIRE